MRSSSGDVASSGGTSTLEGAMISLSLATMLLGFGNGASGSIRRGVRLLLCGDRHRVGTSLCSSVERIGALLLLTMPNGQRFFRQRST